MKVHLFGGVWSPSCAGYALQRTFQDHGRSLPEDVRSASRSFYVDDLLMSVSTPEKATRVAHQIKRLMNRGGFRLTKWICNHEAVLQTLPPTDRAVGVQKVVLQDSRLPTERALGILWDLANDELAVRLQIPKRPLTKRGLLAMVSSIYDPLGIVAPKTIHAKLIFQDECRRGTGWDEQMTEPNKRAWQQWLGDLPYLSQVQIPRCYKPKDVDPLVSVQLHHFSDASQKAYGCVSYLRLTGQDGNHHISFVCGRAKLAPLKQQTIPRLEFCAAVLASNADKQLRSELEWSIDESVFWTDSTAVLHYINSTERRFHTFVANRVAMIHENCRPNQWRHVSSTQNPADDASRGLKGLEMCKACRWIQGPSFLALDESKWPENPRLYPELPEGPEVRRATASLVTNSNQRETILDRLSAQYSSWYRMQKGVAWLRRFLQWLRSVKKEHREGCLTVAELTEAKVAILKLVQKRHFTCEVATLRRGHPVNTGQTNRLEPHLGRDGLIRVGGRLKHALLSPDQRHPILLPRDDPVTELIVRETHSTQAGHSGREHTIVALRERYWIPKCRKLVDRILRTCVPCRKVNWRPISQRQADLPVDRVHSGRQHPFANTGVDCFGPFMIKFGRARAKRWGCLFTCLKTRAIHLEVLASLDTDAFINAITRFTARRGPPERIRSDRGTNMIGANKELREVTRQWFDSNQVRNTLLKGQIEWEFNPPAASHMGGVWERQIRTVRKVLQSVVGSQTMDDERLHTLFCAVEEIVNGRPITPISDDPKDLEALTPLHLRMHSETLPVGETHTIADAYRRRWRHVQFLADQFWKRWVKEYLPTLRQRQKLIQANRNLRVGDVVLICGRPRPRGEWLLGRVVETLPGNDGLIRSVKVKTKDSTLVRPATKLCLLEGVDEQSREGPAL